VCDRERECVCVCDRERERESVCVCEREREREREWKGRYLKKRSVDDLWFHLNGRICICVKKVRMLP
jgi:hypothetical protein